MTPADRISFSCVRRRSNVMALHRMYRCAITTSKSVRIICVVYGYHMEPLVAERPKCVFRRAKSFQAILEIEVSGAKIGHELSYHPLNLVTTLVAVNHYNRFRHPTKELVSVARRMDVSFYYHRLKVRLTSPFITIIHHLFLYLVVTSIFRSFLIFNFFDERIT